MAKICMLTYQYYGNDSRTRREAEALCSRGDEVDVVCLKAPGQEIPDYFFPVKLFPLSVAKYRGNSNIIYLKMYLSFFVRAFFYVGYLHFKRRYDIIQVHTLPDFLIFAALVPKLLGSKIILDVHELMPELYMSKFRIGERHILIRFITWVERISIKFADKAIAVHTPHRDILIKHGNPSEKLSTLLNLADPNIFANGQCSQRQPDGTFRLIYHGTIAERHGLEVAFRAIKLARTEIPVLEFYVMGGGDDRERLVRIVKELDLVDSVKFSEDWVPLQEIPSRIKQADVGVVPILYDEFTRYMLPVKLMEYVRLRMPVIASRTETMEAYFDDTMVRYFKAGDEVELANHIADLYRNPQKRTDLVLNADKFNKKYNWESQKREYFDLIDSLVEAK